RTSPSGAALSSKDTVGRRGGGMVIVSAAGAGRSGAAVPVTTWQLENCEVLLLGSVAVAVTNWPVGTCTPRVTVKAIVPLALVVTTAVSRYFSPSPKPEGWQTALLKKSRA